MRSDEYLRELLRTSLPFLEHDAKLLRATGGPNHVEVFIENVRDAIKRHPGYVIGNHWLETAYERICAGEAEDDVLADYDVVRVNADTTAQTPSP